MGFLCLNYGIPVLHDNKRPFRALQDLLINTSKDTIACEKQTIVKMKYHVDIAVFSVTVFGFPVGPFATVCVVSQKKKRNNLDDFALFYN